MDNAIAPQPSQQIARETTKQQHRQLTQKVGKLVTALYMVSDVVDDTAMQARMRANVLAVLADVEQLIGASLGDIARYASQAMYSIERLSLTLDIAVSLGFVSDMNHQILERVMTSISATLSQEQTTVSYTTIGAPHKGHTRSLEVVIPESLFVEESPDSETSKVSSVTPPPATPVTAPVATDQATPLYRTKEVVVADKPIRTQTVTTHAHVSRPQGEVSGITSEFVSDKSDVARERKERIIAVIRSKGEATTNDIVEFIDDCSVKTLQRHIQDLINDKRIVRDGDKRWAKYKVLAI